MYGDAKNIGNYLAVSKELPTFALRDRYNRYSKKTYQAGSTAYPLSTSASCGCSGLANLKGVRSFCIPIYKRIFDNNARPCQRFATGARCARRRRTAYETGSRFSRTISGHSQEVFIEVPHYGGTADVHCLHRGQGWQRPACIRRMALRCAASVHGPRPSTRTIRQRVFHLSNSKLADCRAVYQEIENRQEVTFFPRRFDRRPGSQ